MYMHTLIYVNKNTFASLLRLFLSFIARGHLYRKARSYILMFYCCYSQIKQVEQ